jgi:hypothetical protein
MRLGTGAVLGRRFDHFPGISTREQKITEWPAGLGPEPSMAQVEIWADEYEQEDDIRDVALARTQVLMGEVTNPVASYDENDDPVNKTAEVIAAEKLELKNLLTAALVGGADLGQVETQTLLRLERE